MAKPPSPEHRATVLNARRELKMARSAHAFVRGSIPLFYEWMKHHTDAVPDGPAIWICGDCHVGNLGPIGHVEGRTVVELRDLDQAVIGNPAYDVTRLALSLAMAARSSDLPGVTTARITEDLVAGYERAFEHPSVDESVDELPAPIRVVMKRALRRTRKHVFRDRLGGTPRRIPLGRRFWALDAKERAALAELVSHDSVRRIVASIQGCETTKLSFVDAAFWVKGCSSLGLWRAAVLVEVCERTKKGRDCKALALLDLKQAGEPCCPWREGHELDIPPAERIVRAATQLAPALGERTLPTTILDRSVFVRELLPQDLKVELDEISCEDGRAVAYYLGKVVGRAHARQLDGGARRSWYQEIAARRTKSIDAPGWLWQAVIQLVSVHERAYLEHCRRYALLIDRVFEDVTMEGELVPGLVKAKDSPTMKSVERAADAPRR